MISKTEPVTLGFDGSEGRKPGKGTADSTVLIGYSVTQRHLFKIGVWEQPDGPAGEGWRPPVLQIEDAVRQAFKDYNVVGFYADPSAGWAGHVKTWEAEYARRLKVRMSRDEPIRWRQKDLARTTDTFAQLESAITGRDITYDASPELTAHFINARRDRRPTWTAPSHARSSDDSAAKGRRDGPRRAPLVRLTPSSSELEGVFRGLEPQTARK